MADVTLTLTAEQLAALEEVMFAISTENADPVHVMSEPDEGERTFTTYRGGVEFSLRPIVSDETFEAFQSIADAIADQEARQPARLRGSERLAAKSGIELLEGTRRRGLRSPTPAQVERARALALAERDALTPASSRS